MTEKEKAKKLAELSKRENRLIKKLAVSCAIVAMIILISLDVRFYGRSYEFSFEMLYRNSKNGLIAFAIGQFIRITLKD